MFVAVVIVGNLTVTGQAHVGHIPSDVDVEIIGGGVADVGWLGLFTIHSGAPVTSRQKVASVVKFVQNWSGSSSQSWEVAPATVSPDFGESDWNVTFTWWAVVPHFTGIVMSSNSTVGELVDNGFVDVLWDTVSLSFGSERIDETDLSLRSVGGVDVLLVEVDELGLGESSELSDFHGGSEGADNGESSDELHGLLGPLIFLI
jgi:hypothetical protein